MHTQSYRNLRVFFIYLEHTRIYWLLLRGKFLSFPCLPHTGWPPPHTTKMYGIKQEIDCYEEVFTIKTHMAPGTADRGDGTLGRGTASRSAQGRKGCIACSPLADWRSFVVHHNGLESHCLEDVYISTVTPSLRDCCAMYKPINHVSAEKHSHTVW